MKRFRLFSLLVALAASTTVPEVAWAQAAGATFAIDRYNPSERGSDWFVGESLDLRGHKRPALGLVADWSYKPLVLYDVSGAELSPIVRYQLFAHVGGGIILWDRLRLAASAPILLYNRGGSLTTANGAFSSQDGTSFGDLRLGGDVRLLGRYGTPFTIAAGLQLFLPTGNQDAYAGDGSLRLLPRVMGAGALGMFEYAAQVGFHYRAHDGRLDNTPFGSELTFALSAGVRLADKKLLVGPELFGSTVVEHGGAFRRRASPLELLFGAKYMITDDVKLGAGVGPGLTHGMGSPTVRVLASVEWLPAMPPSDRDKDTIYDIHDACPDEPGLPNADPKKHGCPLRDRDKDTIYDDQDACPDEPGPANVDPKKHGCPLRDRDKDTIPDDVDACPDVPGPANADPKKHGCPPQDRDGDKILDEDDACPDEPGPANADPKKHGCPLARIEEGQIVIFERVEFEYNSAVLLPSSDTILNAVKQILDVHRDLSKISIEGHTSSEGAEKYNQDLSDRRAASVVQWLVSHGIAAERLQSRGFGEMRPIDSNETEPGRQKNRRVEFHILEKDGQPVPRVDTYQTKPQSGATAAKPKSATAPAKPQEAAPAKDK